MRTRSRRGSATVMLSMAFVAFAMSIASAIGISRALVVKSECKVCGKVWAKAILSQYDKHLYKDYGIMSYYGNEEDVAETISSYISYSISGKLNAKLGITKVDLYGYELSDADNFRSSVKNSFIESELLEIAKKKQRIKIEDDECRGTYGHRKVGNQVVIDTLPSCGIKSNIDIASIKNSIKDKKGIEQILTAGKNASWDINYMRLYLGNHMSKASKKETYLRNEWEYVLSGSKDDEENYSYCKKKLLALRTGLNLIYLYKDPKKIELILSVASVITPEAPEATQALIAEAWAAIEAKEDVDSLVDGGKVPIMKTAESWKTDIGSALGSDELISKLDDEAKKLLNKKTAEYDSNHVKSASGESGLDYDEYLMIMIAAVSENVRTLRIMDIIDINMRYRYYDDFNMDEYHIGVRYYIEANGRKYEITDEYE